MKDDVGRLARKLARIQSNLRSELLEVLREHNEDLETILSPQAFSPLVHELRDKYLSRLFLIQGVLQQLAEYNHRHNRRATRVLAVGASDQDELVKRVNNRLLELRGCKVLDVKFMPGTESQPWSALITYEANPFSRKCDETAALM